MVRLVALRFCLLISTLCFLCVAWGVCAPVPNVKSPEPTHLPLAGLWRMGWNGGEGMTYFHEKGGYTCEWCGQHWIGEWKVAEGVLTVREAVEPKKPGQVPDWFTWKASLAAGTRSGLLEGGGGFALTPAKPDKVPAED